MAAINCIKSIILLRPKQREKMISRAHNRLCSFCICVCTLFSRQYIQGCKFIMCIRGRSENMLRSNSNEQNTMLSSLTDGTSPPRTCNNGSVRHNQPRDAGRLKILAQGSAHSPYELVGQQDFTPRYGPPENFCARMCA